MKRKVQSAECEMRSSEKWPPAAVAEAAVVRKGAKESEVLSFVIFAFCRGDDFIPRVNHGNPRRFGLSRIPPETIVGSWRTPKTVNFAKRTQAFPKQKISKVLHFNDKRLWPRFVSVILSQ